MIHQYKNNGYNIVLDVNSGAVHVVDDIVYDVIPVVGQIFEKKESKNHQILTEEEKAEAMNSVLSAGLSYDEELLKELFGN